MLKKRPVSSSSSSSLSTLLRRFRLGSRLMIPLLVLLCFLSVLGLHSHSKLYLINDHFEGSPKIAFLFLVRENLPLDFLWDSFFKNADVANFSIYIHSKPGFVFDESTTMSAFFYNREMSKSVQVGWGEPSMIEAERLLLEEALADPDNQRFVLLSDSCVPLYNFSYVYNYLMSSPRSYVEIFLDVNDTRYRPKMLPVIPKDKWRKGSQWITLVRRHAEVVVQDDIVFPVFKKFCKKLRTQDNCIPDEHYVQTLLMMRAVADELEHRTLTFSLWRHPVDNMDATGWHPVTFNYKSAERQHIKEIKDISYVASGNQTEWCYNNSMDAPCYLFARKFSRGAAIRLLTDGVVGPYDDPTEMKIVNMHR